MATKMLMPKLSDTMDEGVILKWRKKEGESIKQGDILADIQSDKADMEQEAYDSGVILKLFVKEGEGVKVGAPLVIIGKAGEDIAHLLSEAPASTPPSTQSAAPAPVKEVPAAPVTVAPQEAQSFTGGNSLRVKASPLAKKIAQENNIDLAMISGSGPGGRIIRRDVESTTSAASTKANVFAQKESVKIPLSMMRKTIAKRLLESKSTVPHFYLTVEINMKRAIEFRNSLNSSGDIKISYNDLVVKATALALRQNPKANSSFGGDHIVQHGRIDISIAVAIDEGLITPVLRSADMKGLADISSEIKDLAKKAREGKLKPEEFTNGTFTISNLGMFDIENFAAIINPPEGAILAVGAIIEKPVVEHNTLVAGHTMKVTLSCDHRVIDGAIGAAFLQSFKRILENPALLAL